VDIVPLLVSQSYTQSVGLLGRGISLPPPTHSKTEKQNKRTQISMPRVGFEPTIPVLERAKPVGILLHTRNAENKRNALTNFRLQMGTEFSYTHATISFLEISSGQF
jgi:hypothetical protein